MRLRTINNLTQAARLVVNNTAKDAEVAKKLGQFGFPARRIQEGKDLLTAVLEMQQAQKVCYDEGWQIANQIEQELLMLRPIFMDHVTAVRFAFRRDPAVLRTFDVKRISMNKWTWIEQARAFYETIGAYREQMAVYGVASEELAQAQASVAAIIELRDDRMHKKGEAEDSTESRDQASQLLKEWVREFHTAARLALKDNPQKLEAFGIKVPSLQK